MSEYSDYLSPMSFRMPSWLVDSGWVEHGPFGMWLVEQLQPRLIVELGTYRGYSAMAFCEALKVSENKPGRVVAVDTWMGDAHAGHYASDVYDQLKNYTEQHHNQTVQLKRMYFSEALPTVPDGSVDLLHIDGRHFYEDVREDYLSWVPKLSDRAVILFHDTQERRDGFGVWKYWAELTREHPCNFEFLHGHGLGVLSRSGNLPPKLATLLSPTLSIPVRDQVRNQYERLGGGCGAQLTANLLQAREARRKLRQKHPVKFLVDRLKRRFSR
jgi:Methyltransferase domain